MQVFDTGANAAFFVSSRNNNRKKLQFVYAFVRRGTFHLRAWDRLFFLFFGHRVKPLCFALIPRVNLSEVVIEGQEDGFVAV